MKLASGTAPVTKYLKEGVALGLGTDGAASNNDLDMFEAMRQASFLPSTRRTIDRGAGAGGARPGHPSGSASAGDGSGRSARSSRAAAPT